jgi:phage head maturation protease
MINANARLPDSEWGRPVAAAVQRGDISAMSFGFMVDQRDVSWEGRTRTLHSVDLLEVSTVSGSPAYPTTRASVRAASEYRESMADALQDALRQLVCDPRALTDTQPAMLSRYVDDRLAMRPP